MIFGPQGGIDQIYYYDPTIGTDGGINFRKMGGSLYLFVTSLETEPLPNHGILDSAESLWVTVNDTTGGVNVGYNTPSPVGNLATRIINSRSIAGTGQSASQ